MSRTFLLLIGLILVVAAKDFTQSQVVEFLVERNLLPKELKLSSFTLKDGKYVVTFEKDNTQKKVILRSDEQDRLRIVLIQQFSSFSFSAQIRTHGRNEPMPTPMLVSEPQNQEMISGEKEFRSKGMEKMKKMREMKGCSMKLKKSVSLKFYEQFPEYQGAEIGSYQKHGFRKGLGVSITFIVDKDSQKKVVNGFYRPRINQLLVSSIKAVEEGAREKREGEGEEGLIMERGEMVGQNEEVEKSLVQGNHETISEDIILNLRDERR